MKKFKLLSLLLALCLLFSSFVGCSKDVDEESSTSATEATVDNVSSTSTTIISDKNENTVNNITDIDEITVIYPKENISLNDGWECEVLGYSIKEGKRKYRYEITFTLRLLSKGTGEKPFGFTNIWELYAFDFLGSCIINGEGGNQSIDMDSFYNVEIGETFTETYWFSAPNLSKVEFI